ncbi:MAG: hypothetical protein D6731_11080 [Planctomycetota bacterium]|nr:MAG: hypothetical protein D6731_11080 [Planctomycetota bacterium]
MRSPRLFLVLATLLSTACVGTHRGRPERRGPRSVEPRERRDVARPELWRRVYLGSLPRPELVGYVRTDDSGGVLTGAHFVYDAGFALIGRISPVGRTVRIGPRGNEEDLGTFELRDALRRLWNRGRKTEVRLRPMPPPRG